MATSYAWWAWGRQGSRATQRTERKNMVAYDTSLRKTKLNPLVLGWLLLILLFADLALVPDFALAEAANTIEITGEGVAHPMTLSFNQLEAMQQYEHIYSVINTWPTKRWYTARGIKLRELLNQAGIKDDATLIKFISSDGYDVTLTVKELLTDKRYYFPGLKDNHPNDGSIPGSSEGAEEVEPILALVSAEGSDDPAAMNDRDALMLVLGQRAVTEQTNNLFLKYINTIEVLATPPEKWDNPKANIPSGTELPVGTEIELSNKNNNEDKIYYTTDGSTPTINSPMYNWSASRWWDQHGDVKGVNKPIEVKENTVIKMITIGPGKLDSEVVTFKFTADMSGKAVDPTKVPGGPPTGISLDRNRIDLPVGSTFRLEATVTPFNATNQGLVWSSSDTRVTTVDNRGLVTVVGPGTAVITVTTVDGNYTAYCVVNGPDQEQDEEATPITTSTEPNLPDPVQQLPEPGPKPEVNSVPDSNTFAEANLPAESTIPEDRAQYLAKIEDLGVDSNQDAVSQEPFNDNWQVFEMSADTIPLPLKAAQDRMKIYSTIMLLIFFLSGAGQKYAQFTKERL